MIRNPQVRYLSRRIWTTARGTDESNFGIHPLSGLQIEPNVSVEGKGRYAKTPASSPCAEGPGHSARETARTDASLGKKGRPWVKTIFNIQASL